MTLERIAVLHKVLAQLSPAGSPANIQAVVAALRELLASGRLQVGRAGAAAARALQLLPPPPPATALPTQPCMFTSAAV
jgi:hypothetical protein